MTAIGQWAGILFLSRKILSNESWESNVDYTYVVS